jgi:glycosyltransferase involved in cell wall biosynthesis
MKIVIATGIYPPEVGGPAYYARGLAEALHALGVDTPVVTYGWLKKLPTGVRHIAYLFRLAPHLLHADACIALDTFSVALPSVFLGRAMHVPVIIRTGGDFLWESYVERTRDLLPLMRFYDEHQPLTRKERIVFSLTRWAVRHARMVFSTDLQRDIWMRAYGITAPVRVIGNAIEASLPSEPSRTKNFLWHVRPNAIKNSARVHEAFAKAHAVHPDIVLEEGTMPKDELLERMKSCYAVILPSLTEISPNYILDAIRFRKPFIMDKYSGLADALGSYGMLVDPLDTDDIARAIGELATEEGYRKACERVARFDTVRTYADIARDFLAMLQ